MKIERKISIIGWNYRKAKLGISLLGCHKKVYLNIISWSKFFTCYIIFLNPDKSWQVKHKCWSFGKLSPSVFKKFLKSNNCKFGSIPSKCNSFTFLSLKHLMPSSTLENDGYWKLHSQMDNHMYYLKHTSSHLLATPLQVGDALCERSLGLFLGLSTTVSLTGNVTI